MIYKVTIDYEPSYEEVEAATEEEAKQKAFALVQGEGEYASCKCWVGLIENENGEDIYAI